MKTIQWLATLLLALILSACASSDLQKMDSTLAAPEYANIPAAQPAQPAAQVDPYAKINQGVFSLSLKNVEIHQALAILSKKSPISIVAESGVSGRVTVNIKDKPLGDLLAVMLRPLNYSARVEDGVIVVGPSRPITRSFVLNYVKGKRDSTSTTNASISTSSGSGSDSSTSGRASTSGGGGQGNVSVTTTGSNDFWAETIKGVEAIVNGPLKKGETATGSRIITNQLAGVIQVTAPAATMETVSAFLADIELEVKRQVLIQAHIAEIELNDRFSMGIDWKAFLDSAHKYSVAQNLAPTPLSNAFVLNINTSDFTLLLDAFKEQGDVKMLSSPKISTLNNQKAVIKLTTKEVTWVQSVLRGNGTSTTDIVINTPQIDEVGLFLDVTPNIAASNNITMQVHPSITEVKSESKSPDGTSSKPVITVREIDVMVDVMSGQTMVIGGLISDKFTSVRRGVPILGDIPYLGWLFSNITQQKKKTELVIFLTPYVLNSDAIDQIRKTHEERIWGSTGINRAVESALE